MGNNEKIKQDLVVGLDFIASIIQNPKLLEEIPDGSAISFLDNVSSRSESKAQQKMKKKYVKVKREFEVL